MIPWIVTGGLALAPLPDLDQPEEDAAPTEPADVVASPEPAEPDDPLAPPQKSTGDDDDPMVLEDAGQDESTLDADAPPPGAVGPAEYKGRYVSPPTDQALDRQATVTKPARRRKFKRPGSPQRFAMEVKLGPYLPDVDRNYDGPFPGPYAEVFGKTDSDGRAVGDPKNALMVAGAFEWQIVYLAGPLGLGLQVAFMRDKADALIADPAGDNARSDADSVTFSVLPLALQAVYRFEYLADRFKVPLVPYAKAGPAYAFWWSKDGDGKISENDAGEKGRGGVWGFQINAGGMLRLDFIERGTAKTLDRTTGINHTYIFGEYQYSLIDNFGSGNAMSLGDSTWFGGLAIEF